MLTEKKKAYFKKLLNKMLMEFQSQAANPNIDPSDLKNDFIDFTDQASLETDLDIALHIRERGKKLIRKINNALERIKKDTYGICEECGEDISEKRLKARPVATLCIDCKKREENNEKLRGL